MVQNTITQQRSALVRRVGLQSAFLVAAAVVSRWTTSRFDPWRRRRQKRRRQQMQMQQKQRQRRKRQQRQQRQRRPQHGSPLPSRCSNSRLQCKRSTEPCNRSVQRQGQRRIQKLQRQRRRQRRQLQRLQRSQRSSSIWMRERCRFDANSSCICSSSINSICSSSSSNCETASTKCIWQRRR